MPSRPALVLLAVGLVLLPGPAYAVLVDSVRPDRVAAGYSAERVDLDDPDTRARLAETFGHEVTVSLHHVDDASSHPYRTPDRTAAVLRRAYRGMDPVRVTDDAVRADVEALARNASFLRPDFDHDPRRLVVHRRDGALLVSTRETNASAVFAAVRGDVVVDYDALSPAERDTVDRVLRTAGADDAYYRPYENEPHPTFPAIVERDGNHYLVQPTVHVDDFGFDGLVAGIGASAVGLLFLFGGAAVALVERRGTD